jgi:peroxiredoxin
MKLKYTLGLLFSLSILYCSNLVFASDLMAEMGIQSPKIRHDAPSFSLQDLDGKSVSLADFQGKLILLNFWASWCTPCLEEMPAMQAAWEKYSEQGFVILAIAGDRGNSKAVRKFVSKLNLTFPVLLDPDGDVRNDYEVMALPTSYIIGRDGKIAGRVTRSKDWASEKADALIESML